MIEPVASLQTVGQSMGTLVPKPGSVRRVDSCRICGNTELAPILNLGDQALTGVFPRTREQAITRGPLELVKCVGGSEVCGLVQLHHSYSSGEMYGENYGYRSSLNRSMVGHLSAKVDGLQEFVSLGDGDVVLDIGSNDGTTLSFYPKHLVRIGMDPTAGKFRDYYPEDVHAIADFFSAERFKAEVGARKAKIITSIAMFYDLENPCEFVEQIASVLDDDGIWHFEQSYMPLMLAQTAYDTICHEHLEYYGLGQIKWLVEQSGLELVDVRLNDVNGGSFAVTAAKKGSHFTVRRDAVEHLLAEEDKAGMQTLAPFARFATKVNAHRQDLLALLQSISAEGSTVLGYGASTKGNVILQFCGLGPEDIPCIADVNPDKFGCFTPGSRIPIVPESVAHSLNPDYLLVMPWHFRQNLVNRESAFLRRGGKMILPLPALEIVG